MKWVTSNSTHHSTDISNNYMYFGILIHKLNIKDLPTFNNE